MDYTCIFFGVLFTIAGFVFACGKGHIHLSAWKNMPQEEKEKIKIILMKGLWSGFAGHWFVAAMIAWLMIAGFDVWYIGKSNRYRKK